MKLSSTSFFSDNPGIAFVDQRSALNSFDFSSSSSCSSSLTSLTNTNPLKRCSSFELQGTPLKFSGSSIHIFMTMSQRRELEIQYLIAKYLMSGHMVPTELLNSFRISLMGILTVPPYHLDTFNRGGYNMGFKNNVDPEPGRCRRTDGKKWRCSKEVAPDHKYCERHLHRGKSKRKSVIQQVSSQFTQPSNADVPVNLPISSPSQNHPSQSRAGIMKDCDLRKNDMGFIPEQMFFCEGAGSTRGSLCLDSMHDSKALWMMPSMDIVREPEGQPLRPFFDDWSRVREPGSALTWPDIEDDEDSSYHTSTTTQLSISIPSSSSTSDFNNGTSPRQLALSPPLQSVKREGGKDTEPLLRIDPTTQIALGTGIAIANNNHYNNKSWIPDRVGGGENPYSLMHLNLPSQPT